MHALERIVRACLEMLLQKSGLTHDATVAQTMYSVAYYWDSLLDSVQALTLCLLGGDISRLGEIPAAIRCGLSLPSETRWLAQERLAAILLLKLNVPAT
jgi:hypothetical protein